MRLKRPMVNYLKNIRSEIVARISSIKPEVHFDVPFFAQDPEAESAFESSHPLEKRDYDLWVDSACGMFCLKMILKYKFNKEYSVIDLAKEAMDNYGAYFIGTDRKLSAMKY